MQNKGLVKMFALLFGLVSIYQLSFTFKGNQLENKAGQFAINKVADTETDYDSKRNLERIGYLDSLKNKEVFNIGIASYTYDEVKEKAMNLGLDLKGGINVILQISVKDILVGLANDSKDPTFRKALKRCRRTSERQSKHLFRRFFCCF
jgi:SecD/SecF fusion protein